MRPTPAGSVAATSASSAVDERPRALLLGGSAADLPDFCYVSEPPWEAVVLGLLTPRQLLYPDDAVFEALIAGVPVYRCRQRFTAAPQKLLEQLLAAERQLRQWGVRRVGSRQFTSREGR